MRKKIAGIMIAVSLIGLADAGYLTIKHYRGEAIVCSILAGCDTVTNSKYATVWGVPVAGLGALFYLAVFLLLAVYVTSGAARWQRWITWLTVIGAVTSAYFVSLQALVIHAYCQYCLLSALTSWLLVAGGLMINKKTGANYTA